MLLMRRMKDQALKNLTATLSMAIIGEKTNKQQQNENAGVHLRNTGTASCVCVTRPSADPQTLWGMCWHVEADGSSFKRTFVKSTANLITDQEEEKSDVYIMLHGQNI